MRKCRTIRHQQPFSQTNRNEIMKSHLRSTSFFYLVLILSQKISTHTPFEKGSVPISIKNDGMLSRHFNASVEEILQYKELYMAIRANTQVYSLDFQGEFDKKEFDNLIFNEENEEDFQYINSQISNNRSQITPRTQGFVLHGPRGNGRKLWIKKLAAEHDASIIYLNTLGLFFPAHQVSRVLAQNLFRLADLQQKLTQKKVFLVFDNLNLIAPNHKNSPCQLTPEIEMGLKTLSSRIDNQIFTFALVDDIGSLDTDLWGYDKLGESFGFFNPNNKTKINLLKKFAKKYSFSKNIDIKWLANKFDNYSVAGIENTINTAYLICKRRRLDEVSQEIFISIFNNSEQVQLNNNELNTELSETVDLSTDNENPLQAKFWKKGSVQTKFSDVIVDPRTKAEVTDILLFIKEPERFKKTGGKVPNGMILYGPTGTGKTLFAKALAGEAGCSFLSVNSSMLTSKYLGDSSRNIQKLFKYAREVAARDKKPCIIFMDEIDSFTLQRGASYGTISDDNRQMLNQFLCELDGFDKKHGEILLIAATNRFNDIDKAVLRPGRLDRHICMELPSCSLRKEMFQLNSQNFNFGKDVSIDSLASSTVGFSGAEIKNMVNEAAIIAAKEGESGADFITQDHLNQAYLKFLLGVENRSLGMTAEDTRLTAYHESGHALVAVYSSGPPLKQLTCIPRGSALGVTITHDDEDINHEDKARLFSRLAVKYGGLIAEEMITNTHGSGVSSDLKSATSLATTMVCELGMSKLGNYFVPEKVRSNDAVVEAIKSLMDEAEESARQILKEHEPELHCLAQRLIERETMSGDEVKELLAEFKKTQPNVNSPQPEEVVCKGEKEH